MRWIIVYGIVGDKGNFAFVRIPLTEKHNGVQWHRDVWPAIKRQFKQDESLYADGDTPGQESINKAKFDGCRYRYDFETRNLVEV